MLRAFIGWDPREAAAFAVARYSARRHLSAGLIGGLVLEALVDWGIYNRPMERRDTPAGGSVMWDVISDAPMSTEHACARFLVPFLVTTPGWVLFMDGDVLVRGDLAAVLQDLDPAKALYCVQHAFDPPEGAKMDGQLQTRYARKNWSSFMLFNVGHPSNRALTVDLVNGVPGRDLHRFCWLDDADIGALDPRWNHLVGHSPGDDPAVAHFTDGTPDMAGYEDQPFAEEWRFERRRWVEA